MGESIVTVIVPCLNEERRIAECLDSIIANDYPKDKLEILVVDGGSRDKTREIIEKYKIQNTRYKIQDTKYNCWTIPKLPRLLQ